MAVYAPGTTIKMFRLFSLFSPLVFSAWLLAVAGLLAPAPAWAVHLVGNIELDGNTVNDGAAVPGTDDWDDVFNGTDHAIRTTFVTDTTVLDSTAFSGGVKDTQSLDKWTCRTTSVQAKSNIQHAYSATYQSAGDLMFYAGADREGNLGDANMGVWLFQGPVGCVSTGATTPFFGTHLDGDLLLVAEFDQGGRVESVLVYRWSDPDGIPQNGDECLGGDNGDCTDVGIPAFIGLNCNDSPAGDGTCGRTNPVSAINAAWRPGIPKQGFYETGVNLNRVIGDIGCFANAIVETRSSTSLTATLKDFVVLEISTCASLAVEKQTVGGDAEFGFSVVPNAGGPDEFELSNGESQFFGAVSPGSYTISEAVMPPGPPAPNGWNLTNLECASGTPGIPEYIDGGHGGGSISVGIGLADDVVCTFTNTFTPPAGSITIQKLCESQDPGMQTFNFALGGFAGSTTPACADGVETLACGESITCLGLGAGGYTVGEPAPPMGWQLTDVSCTGPAVCGTGPSPQASITLGAGGSAVATFTNTENATIEICKSTLPSGSGGDFNFTGALGNFSIADGECQGPVEVTPLVAADITESAQAGFLLENINCSGSNWVADPAGTRTVTIMAEPGEAVSCTFFNTENPGEIRVCKNTVAPSGADPAFDFELTGPDPALPVSTSLTNGGCDFGAADANPHLLVPGTGYAVTETPAVGWSTTVSCVGAAGAEDPSNIDLSPDETVTCTFVNTEGTPAIDLVKSGVLDLGGDGIANPGDVINYSLMVSNTGDVELSDVAVSDPLVSPITCPSGNPIPLLLPGASEICTGFYAITQGDIDAGALLNTATVVGNCPLLACPVQDEDSHSEPIPQVLAIAIVKTADPLTYSTLGQVISYTFDVSNPGNVSLFNVSVSDPLPGLSAISCPGGNPVPSLPPGTMVQCSASYSITSADINTGMVTNTATVTGDCPNRGQFCVTDEDSETVTVVRVNLGKSVNGPATLQADGSYTVGFTITATNLGGGPARYDLVDSFSPGSGITLNTVTATYQAGTENSQTGTLGDYPDFVTGEDLGDGLDESWLVIANFLVDPALVVEDDRDCDPGAPVSGTGFYNEVSGSDTDIDPADNDSCTGLPDPVIDLAKDAVAISENGDGSFDVTYQITATNLADGPGMYDLIDTVDPGTGVIVVSAQLTNYIAGTENDQSGTLAPPGSFPIPFASGDTLVSGEALAGQRSEGWTIVVTFELDLAQVGADLLCAGPGTGTYNSVTGSGTDPDPGNNADCINPPQMRATFRVQKDFDDDNPAGVAVTISCNTGLPLQQSRVIHDFGTTGDYVEFVVGDFVPGAMDCDIDEANPAGYLPGYLAGVTSGSAVNIFDDSQGCHYEGVAGGQFTCEILNVLQTVEVVVEKQWIDDHPEFIMPLWVDVTLACDGEIVGGFEDDGTWSSSQYIDPANPGTWNVYPHFGGTHCAASEQKEPGVVPDESDCEAMIVFPGEGDRCVIVNTRLFAGIPTLSHLGLLLFGLMMLGFGVLAYRQYD